MKPIDDILSDIENSLKYTPRAEVIEALHSLKQKLLSISRPDNFGMIAKINELIERYRKEAS